MDTGKLKIRINTFQILSWLMALFLILNCQSIWQNTIDRNYHIYEICLCVSIVCCLYTLNRWGISKTAFNYSMIISILYLINIIVVIMFSVSKDNMIRFLSRYLIFPFYMIFFASSAPTEKKLLIFKRFVDWVAVIAWISVFFWSLSSLGIIAETGTINVRWFDGYASYYNLYFSTWYQCIDFVGIAIRRNIAIFTEGPMYMYVLVMALLFNGVLNEYYPTKMWKKIGIMLGILSVASITGFIFVLIYWGIQLLQGYKDQRKQIMIGVFALGIVIVGVYILLSIKSNTASYVARFDDYLTGIKCWIKSPVIGNGYENSEVLKMYMSRSRRFNTGFSNTIFSVLAYGGIIFALVYLIPVIRAGVKSLRINDYKMVLFCGLYVLLYFTVIFYTFYLNFFILAFLMCIYKTIDIDEKPYKWEAVL